MARWFLRGPVGPARFAAAAALVLLLPRSAAQESWTSGVIRGSDVAYSAVAANGSAWVAVGSTGAVRTSSDGLTWTNRSSGTTTNLRGLAFGAGLFVAVGNDGVILTSPTGQTWTPRTSGTTKNLYAVVFGGSQFVATGIDGTVLTSPDGVSWTTRAVNDLSGLPLTASLLGVTHSGSLYVAAGSNGTVITSANGVTWTQIVPFTGLWLYGIAYGNGRFVVVGDQGIVRESTNGTTWTDVAVNWPVVSSFPDTVPLQGVTFGGGKFVAVGFRGTILQGAAGGGGLAIAFQGRSGAGILAGAGHGSSGFVAVGDLESFMSSTDGVTWAGVPPHARAALQAVASNGTDFVVAAINNTTTSSLYRTSTFSSWSTALTAGPLYGLAYGGGAYVAVGGQILTSPNGTTWTTTTFPPTTSTDFRDVTYGGGQFVTVGISGRILTSPTGATWTSRVSGTTVTLFGVTHANSLYVVVGAVETGAGQAVIRTSPDGVTWTARTSGVSSALRSVAFGAGRYVAVGDGGVVTTSTNGITWTPGQTPLPQLNRVIFANNWFIAASNNQVFISQDGIAWSARSLPSLGVVRGLGLRGNIVLAVGDSEAFATSDGTSNLPPTITLQPLSTTVVAGQNASFSFGASGSPAPTLRWQRSIDAGQSWQDVPNAFPYSGATGVTLTVLGTTLDMTGHRFRGVATNSEGSATSLPALLTVNQPTFPIITTSPANQTITVSQVATFIVVASGAEPLQYQWQRLPAGSATWANLSNGGNYAGATLATLQVTGSATTQTGDQFRCVVSNVSGTATSGSGTLTVNPPPTPPTIVTAPADRSLTVGESTTFGVVAGGTPPFLYQWQRKPAGSDTWTSLSTNSTYVNPSGPTLSVNLVTLAMSGDQFRCVVSNAQGSVNSPGATLTVSLPNQPPSFTLQPANVSANTGGSASFSVLVAGNPTPALQWQSSADSGGSWQNVSGATSATLMLSGLQLSQNGLRYRAVATNGAGSATSSVAILTVTELILPTVITSQPIGGSYRVGQPLALFVGATGSGPFQYRWFRDGRPLAGQTGESLGIAALTAADDGAYHVEVTGRGGTAASRGTAVRVLVPPSFTQQPLDALVEAGLNASFVVRLDGVPTPRINWYGRAGNGSFVELGGASTFTGVNTPTLVLNAIGANFDGFQVKAIAANEVGAVESAVATVRVTTAATGFRITSQPRSVLVRAGGGAAFTVVVDGVGPFTYQWRKDGATLPGRTTATLAIERAQGADSGGYSVVIRDASGRGLSSNTAFLTVAGAVDPAFDPGGGPDEEITQLLALRDGGFLGAGRFTRVSGFERRGLVRLLPDGTVDPAFDPGTGPSGAVQALVELAGGRFLVVGQFDRYNGVAVPGVVRINADGSRDTSFAPTLPEPPLGGTPVPVLERFHYAAISLEGGGYLLGGRSGVAALTVNGAVIPQSVFLTNGGVFALLQQFNGGLLIGGDFTLISGFLRPRIARLGTDFRLDLEHNVGTGPNGAVQTLLLAGDGSVYVMGRFTSFDGRARPSGIARIAPNGALDAGYNPPLAALPVGDDVASVAATGAIRPAAGRLEAIRAGQVQANGGLAVTTGAATAQSVVALSPAGTPVGEVDVPVQGAANTLASASDGEVAIGGLFSGIAGTDRGSVGVVTDGADASRLINLSCRSRVAGDSSLLILGFVIQGTESMRVLIRGAGPTLQAFGIGDALSRPVLRVFDGAGRQIVENRSWRVVPDPDGLARAMEQVGAFAFNSTDDTAVLLNLLPGSYTAHLGGLNGAQGVALGEIYAVDQGRSRLVNSSVRGNVGTGENLLIPGFTIAGGTQVMLLRAVGPGLAQFGVPGTLERPAMELRRDGAVLATNIGWTTGYDPAALRVRSAAVGAFPLAPQSADSAVLVALQPGGHTVTVSGVAGGTGAALVEVYDANGIPSTPINQ